MLKEAIRSFVCMGLGKARCVAYHDGLCLGLAKRRTLMMWKCNFSANSTWWAKELKENAVETGQVLQFSSRQFALTFEKQILLQAFERKLIASASRKLPRRLLLIRQYSFARTKRVKLQLEFMSGTKLQKINSVFGRQMELIFCIHWVVMACELQLISNAVLFVTSVFQAEKMNRPKFLVKLAKYSQINSIDGGWAANDYLMLLEKMEFAPEDATTEEELRELCVMCLQDSELIEAAKVVLNYKLGDKLTSGQIKSASKEISDEKLWEQYADQSLHEQFFHIGSLMYAAFPREMYEPDAVRLLVEIVGANQEAKDILALPLHESFIVRLLADGMDKGSILHRLFDDQLNGSTFPEAESIVWIINPVSMSGDSVLTEVYSSCHWLDALERITEFDSVAMPDKIPSVS